MKECFNSHMIIVLFCKFNDKNFNSPFLPASPKAKAGLGVQSLRPSVRLSVRLSVPKSCHRNSSETTDPIITKLM